MCTGNTRRNVDMVAGTGTTVVTLEATDNDAPSTPGGQVKYRFVSGSEDDFVIDRTTGVVTIGDGVTLNYVTRPRYNITVCMQRGLYCFH